MKLIEFSSETFLYTESDKTFSAFASDMENRHQQRLYDDACDIGFAIKSQLTGNVVVFCQSKVVYHGDGEDREIAGWNYVPTAESVRKYPTCAGTKAIVFND